MSNLEIWGIISLFKMSVKQKTTNNLLGRTEETNGGLCMAEANKH